MLNILNKQKIMIISIILSVNILFAYEAETNHSTLSKIALKKYDNCFPNKNLFNKKESNRIIQGNVSMDKGLDANLFEQLRLRHNSVFSLTGRPFNWHFYNQKKEESSRIFLIEQSHERLWEKLKKGLVKNKYQYDKLLFLGGIIHLLEDLTVPAHVIPVYHGPTSAKILGPKRIKPLVTYMQELDEEHKHKIKDKIDSFKITQEFKNKIYADTSICSNINTEFESIEKLREQTVNFVLNELEKEIPKCKGTKWHDFWTKSKKGEYFGRYNINDGKNVLFGEEGKLITENGKVCNFEKKDKRYKDFVSILHKKAIENDMKVLLWWNNSQK